MAVLRFTQQNAVSSTFLRRLSTYSRPKAGYAKTLNLPPFRQSIAMTACGHRQGRDACQRLHCFCFEVVATSALIA
jgi:hypothetical protein